MFEDATSFNQALNFTDTSQVTDMTYVASFAGRAMLNPNEMTTVAAHTQRHDTAFMCTLSHCSYNDLYTDPHDTHRLIVCVMWWLH